MLKWLAILLLMIGLGLGYHSAQSYLKFKNGSPSTRLQILWENDLELLEQASSLPKQWDQIREIKIDAATDNAKKWMQGVYPPITIRPDGTHRLEILVISWEEEKEHGVIIQYNLVELKNENMIWELGRTLIL